MPSGWAAARSNSSLACEPMDLAMEDIASPMLCLDIIELRIVRIFAWLMKLLFPLCWVSTLIVTFANGEHYFSI